MQWKPSHHMPPKMSRPKFRPVSGDVADCADDITPDCLRALYGIPALNPKTKLNVCVYFILTSFLIYFPIIAGI